LVFLAPPAGRWSLAAASAPDGVVVNATAYPVAVVAFSVAYATTAVTSTARSVAVATRTAADTPRASSLPCAPCPAVS
jgi:hypothetical protein